MPRLLKQSDSEEIDPVTSEPSLYEANSYQTKVVQSHQVYTKFYMASRAENRTCNLTSWKLVRHVFISARKRWKDLAQFATHALRYREIKGESKAVGIEERQGFLGCLSVSCGYYAKKR